eukprot:TRINITY_DN9287_c0_g1_i2.p1 TRINITY_DN9287_c0_g1~~TRINITY_DN9287_c0_g1_i2.p1  ORF type:complete len:282 (-),score=44.96 TRINITY_DN9287_c0_g1_i2:117-962(-)
MAEHKSLQFWWVIAFRNVHARRRGNPAGVCLLNEPVSDEWMESMARVINLSATAFIIRRPQEEDAFDLRWFTPAVEVNLCGYATLACASVVFSEGMVDKTHAARFHAKCGVLICKWTGEDQIEMDFPAYPPKDVQPPAGLMEVLGISEPQYCGKNLYHLVEVGSVSQLHSLRPDFASLKRIKEVYAVCVTAAAGPESPYNYEYRLFAPSFGLDEDPLCGSVNCCAGPYWQRKTGDNSFVAHAASEWGGGLVHVTPGRDRVILAGKAQLIARGEIMRTCGTD